MQDTSFKHLIDRELLNLAIKNFLEHGGQIEVLPPQKISSNVIIAEQEWAAYESLSDFIG